MLQSADGFFLFSWKAAGTNSDPFAPKYHHFVSPLLHSLMPFTTRPDASQHSLPLLDSACMHLSVKQLYKDQLRTTEWSCQLNTPLGCIVNLDAATVKHRTRFFWFFWLVFFFSFRKNVVVCMVMLPALQMHLLVCLGFLVPSGFPRIRSIYVLLKPMEVLSPYHVNLSGWLSWNYVSVVWWFSWPFWSLCSAYGRKRLSASLLVFGFLYVFKYFSSVFFSFSDMKLAGVWGGRSYSEAFCLTPLAHLLSFEEQQICFPHCWKYSDSLLHRPQLNRGWYLCISSEEICGTFAGICVKDCKTSLSTDMYRQISSK